MTRAGAKLSVCSALTKEERFDWVMGFNFVPHGFNAQHVARRRGIRSMYHVIGGELEWLGGGYRSENNVLGRLPRSVPMLERALLRRVANATVVATMGRLTRAKLLDRGFDPSHVHVIPPSSDLERFRGIGPGDAYDVVSIGRLSPIKQTGDLLAAVALLRGRGRDVRVALAGDGPLRPDLEAAAASLGIGDLIHFLGHVERIEDVYASARLYALTSSYEGLPIALLDAMAAGLPVVSSAVGEIPGVVDSGRNGLLYEPGDVPALAACLERLLDDPDESARMAAAATADVARDYSVEHVAAAYRAAFEAFPAAEG